MVPVAGHVLNPATGDVLRTFDMGPGRMWSTIGSDLVTLGIAEDGHAEATRWSLATGERRWTFRGTEVLPPNDSWGSSVDATVVELDIGAWTLSLDADTGVRIPRVPRRLRAVEAVWGPLALPDGARVVSRFDAGGRTETTVRHPDGSVRATVPGVVVLPTVDDGSAADRLFVARSGAAPGLAVVGADPVTGATRWTSTTRVGRAAVLQGLLLVRDSDALTALDARTGRPRWAVPAGDDTPAPRRGLVTDGHRVLLLEAGPSPALVARDVTTGTTVWSRPTPADDAALAVLDDGTVLLTGSRELVALVADG